MKKINIIKENLEYNRIINSHTPFKYKDYVIYVDRNNSNKNYRFGFSVGKKIGNAVTRNKIKRQLKSIIDKKDYQKNVNCIIIVRKSILEHNFQTMEKYLFEAFEKLDIYNKERYDEEK